MLPAAASPRPDVSCVTSKSYIESSLCGKAIATNLKTLFSETLQRRALRSFTPLLAILTISEWLLLIDDRHFLSARGFAAYCG